MEVSNRDGVGCYDARDQRLEKAKEKRGGFRRAKLTRDGSGDGHDIPAVLGASGEVMLAMVDHRSDLKLMRVAIITPKVIRVDGYE